MRRGRRAAAAEAMAMAGATAMPVHRRVQHAERDSSPPPRPPPQVPGAPGRTRPRGVKRYAEAPGPKTRNKIKEPGAKRLRISPKDVQPQLHQQPQEPVREPIPPWESIAQLNDDQRTLLYVLARGYSIMIIGMGGTGKTFAIQTLLRACMSGQMWLPSYLLMNGIDLVTWIGGWPNVRLVVEYAFSAAELRRTVMCMAPSGVAASLYAPYGTTIHHALGLKDGGDGFLDAASLKMQRDVDAQMLANEAAEIRRLQAAVAKSKTGHSDVLEDKLSNTRAGRMISARLLIVDEVFMTDPALFDLLEETMRLARGNNEFMGGCLVAAVGDPLQLPPVIKDKTRVIVPIYEKWEEQLCLRQTWKVNLRQAGDALWMRILTKLRIGQGLDEEEIRAVMERVDIPSTKENPFGGRPLIQRMINFCIKAGLVAPLRIWTQNKHVDAMNVKQIKTMPGMPFWLGASFTIEQYANNGVYQAYLKVDDNTEVPPLTEIGGDDSKRLKLELSAADLASIRDMCVKLKQRHKNIGGTFLPGMPIRLRTNTDVSQSLANGNRASLLHKVGDLGSRKFRGGLYDLRNSHQTSTFKLARRGAVDNIAAYAVCAVHGTAALARYDDAMRAWRQGGRVGVKPTVPNDDLTLEQAGCKCNGLLATVRPDTPHSKTHLLQPTVIPWRLELDSGTSIVIRMRYTAITPDYARTVDSSQGQTCHHAAVALAQCDRSGQGYTMLSRVTSRDGLAFEPNQITPNMLRQGTPEFQRIFSVRDIHGKPDDEKLRFATYDHVLPRELHEHPTRDAWMQFQTDPNARFIST